jgi:hypothetical protein
MAMIVVLFEIGGKDSLARPEGERNQEFVSFKCAAHYHLRSFVHLRRLLSPLQGRK